MPQSLSKSSSHSSFCSATPSVSSAAKSTGAKAIGSLGRGIKRIKTSVSTIVRPLKRAKPVPSSLSSPINSDEEDDLTIETTDFIDVDEGADDLEKDLGTSALIFFSFLL
jgi:hypothetical protein